MLYANLPFVLNLHFRIKILHCFKILIKVYLKILSMNFGYYYFSFFNGLWRNLPLQVFWYLINFEFLFSIYQLFFINHD